MKWCIFTGRGLQLHSAHGSLAEAFTTVHERIAAVREWRAETVLESGESDGSPVMFHWNAPDRPMTLAEIDASEHPANIKRHWRKHPPRTDDFEAARRIVTFRGEATGHISIVREDRHREYLVRASRLNDNRAYRAEFEAAIAKANGGAA